MVIKIKNQLKYLIIFTTLFILFLISRVVIISNENQELCEIINECNYSINDLQEKQYLDSEIIDNLNNTIEKLNNQQQDIDKFIDNLKFKPINTKSVIANNLVNINDITEISGLNANEFNIIFEGSGFSNHGNTFELAEKLYGINGIILSSIGVAETGIKLNQNASATDNYNPYDIGAYNNIHPSKSKKFKSLDDSTLYLAGMLRYNYVSENGKYYNGKSVKAVNTRYAVLDDGSRNIEWSNNIHSISSRFKRRINTESHDISYSDFDDKYYDLDGMNKK